MKQIANDLSKSSKRHLKKLVLISLLLVFAGGIFIMYQNHLHPYIKKPTFTFSYGDTIPTNSDAYLEYGSQFETVDFDPKLFSMSEIGDYDVEVEFAQERFTLHIAIVDDKPPVIVFSDQNPVTIYEYNGKALTSKLWSIEDDSDVMIEVEPALEKMKEGEQEICVNASDEYDNKTSACQTLKVERKILSLPQIPDVHSAQELVEEFIRQKRLSKASFAFFYDSIHDGETYIYNGDQFINAASTIKVPLNMLYEDAYVEGTKKPEDTIVFIKNDVETGGGDTLKKHRIGEALSYSYLQKQSIENSDNTATNMLVRGLGGFMKFRQQLTKYTKKTMPREFFLQNVVSMNYMHDVMKILYDNQKKYANIIAYMKKAAVGSFLQKSSDVFEIAQKYGQYDRYLHAVGIVYTPRPYLVGIYTTNRADGEAIICELNQWLMAYQLMKE